MIRNMDVARLIGSMRRDQAGADQRQDRLPAREAHTEQRGGIRKGDEGFGVGPTIGGVLEHDVVAAQLAFATDPTGAPPDGGMKEEQRFDMHKRGVCPCGNHQIVIQRLSKQLVDIFHF